MALVGLDGRWLQVNRSLCDLVGRSEPELLGLTFQDITHPDDLKKDLAQASRMLGGEIPSYTMEKRYIHKDGHIVWALLSGAVIPWPDGTPRYCLAQIHDMSPRVAPAVERANDGLPGGNETILVVEDEALVRSSLRRILSRQGYTVLEARHGADALQILDRTPRPVDLVMTDLMMPEMTGRELIPELRARLKNLKIIVMSGYDEKAAMGGESLPAGTGFIEKPFTVKGMLQAVRRALDGKAEQH
jgi:PAS domain S-box-containing protein